MKGKVIALLISTAFLLVGCGSKGTSNNVVQGNKASSAQSSTTENNKTQSSSAQASTATQNGTNGQVGSSVTTDSNSAKTKNVKALTQDQKSAVNQKVGTAMNNINDALQSIQNLPDVDISEANK
ncbi:hypothetical protein [Clostridium folliculivorans]|uniref:Lipoprotein n=1 Tax=Clostridium folliculivorans TaxID=2886038 RepID=A0A9W6D9F6_9CLOT|nr:hypothetical protein [Clostridium folliculivorans]GKU23717.1 hypothetical protein CFOLD11_05430 [Clostridium folliculivorans]GKU29833.1 hypothetical protein CFB3_19400 [Clostridium folliculivorans]